MESKKSIEVKSPKSPKRKAPVRRTMLIVVVVLVLLALATVSLLKPKTERIDTGKYQVVYMASGQAYFGKLRNTEGAYLVLDTPYTAQDVKPPTAEGEDAEVETPAQSSTTLLKVSSQQYGPTETISLKSDQVLFWQNLRDDSKVSQAIKSDSN